MDNKLQSKFTMFSVHLNLLFTMISALFSLLILIVQFVHIMKFGLGIIFKLDCNLFIICFDVAVSLLSILFHVVSRLFVN